MIVQAQPVVTYGLVLGISAGYVRCQTNVMGGCGVQGNLRWHSELPRVSYDCRGCTFITLDNQSQLT